ncbi:MAG: metallophosphoesterase family protein [Oscillospiraceae bacterium]|nr:metallophosphoesterase family protein [Oscillospiraceae bacterium]
MSNRISRAFNNAKELEIDEQSKIVIISDCHRGTGDLNDNFADNEKTYFTALRRYFDTGYTYIELGDCDELWENRKFSMIVAQNTHIFWLLRKFERAKRFHAIYGNHDIVKKSPKWLNKNMSVYYDEHKGKNLPLFSNLNVSESLILRYKEHRLYLIHGHQGDLLCDQLWRLGRFLVRNVWRPLELIGMKDPRSTAENRAKQNKIERRLVDWVLREQKTLIAGHTHRAKFPTNPQENGSYFNTGSCVHPRCITALEINGGEILLVKWGIETRDDGVLFIERSVIAKGLL